MKTTKEEMQKVVDNFVGREIETAYNLVFEVIDSQGVGYSFFIENYRKLVKGVRKHKRVYGYIKNKKYKDGQFYVQKSYGKGTTRTLNEAILYVAYKMVLEVKSISKSKDD